MKRINFWNFKVGLVAFMVVGLSYAGVLWFSKSYLSKPPEQKNISLPIPTRPDLKDYEFDPSRFTVPTQILTPIPTSILSLTPFPSVSLHPTPSSTPVVAGQLSTGAKLVTAPPDVLTAYQELFILLDYDPVFEEKFMIVPLKQKRRIQIYVVAPFSYNVTLVSSWLESHGFSHIPQKNIDYFEQ